LGKVFFRKWVSYVALCFVIIFFQLTIAKDGIGQVVFNQVWPELGGIEYLNASDNFSCITGWTQIIGVDTTYYSSPFDCASGKGIFTVGHSYADKLNGELVLYNSQTIFDETTIEDYIQFGNSVITVAKQHAVLAGGWDDLNKSVPLSTNPLARPIHNFNTAARNGTDTNSFTWGSGPHSYNSFTECDLGSFGSPNRYLSGVEDGYGDHESARQLFSDQVITNLSIVDYDAAVSILLEEGFEIEQGGQLEVFIDGCNLGQGGIH